MTKKILIALCALLATPTLLVTPALAQNANPVERSTGQAVALFLQACVPNVGNSKGLRQWAAGRQLGLLAPGRAKGFLGASDKAMVYGASNADGNFVLVSFDNGRCEVIGQRGDAKLGVEYLTEFLKADKFAIAPGERLDRDGGTEYRLAATRAKEKLNMSLTALPRGNGVSELRLAATK